MQEFRVIARRLRPHRGVALLALVVFAATSYIACGGDDRTFGNGGPASDDSSSSVDTNSDDTTTDSPVDTTDDTTDDTPSTND